MQVRPSVKQSVENLTMTYAVILEHLSLTFERAPGLVPRLSDTSSTVASSVETHGAVDIDRPWSVVVWNDSINLMSYVTYVFQKLFGYSREKATRIMLDVHNKGRAVVSQGTRERAEMDVYRLHVHGLWATLEKSH